MQDIIHPGADYGTDPDPSPGRRPIGIQGVAG